MLSTILRLCYRDNLHRTGAGQDSKWCAVGRGFFKVSYLTNEEHQSAANPLEEVPTIQHPITCEGFHHKLQLVQLNFERRVMRLQAGRGGFEHARKGKAGGKSDMTDPSPELPAEVSFPPEKASSSFYSS